MTGTDRQERSSTAFPPETFGSVLRGLRSAQKLKARGAPAYSVYVNRPFGRVFAAAAQVAGLRPNTVTAISALFSFVAIVSLAVFPPSWGLAAGVALALVVGYALDSADGQLARYQGGGSPAGEWLDHVIDCAKTASLHLAVLVQFARFGQAPEATLLVPIGFTIVAAVSFFAMILNDQLKAVHAAQGAGVGSTRSGGSALRSLAVLPTDYGVLCLSFVLLGAPNLFLAFYALLFLAGLGHLVLALPKWYRDMGALARPGEKRS